MILLALTSKVCLYKRTGVLVTLCPGKACTVMAGGSRIITRLSCLMADPRLLSLVLLGGASLQLLL